MGWQSEKSAWSHGLPNYDDLNVIHELEKKLNADEQVRYQETLAQMLTSRDWKHLTFDMLHSTAAQRREGYLRVKGLWK